MPPALFFFLKIGLAIWGFLWFHKNFRIICSIALKNWHVYRDCIEPVDFFVYYVINFNNVDSIHGHGIYFHSFVYFSISFINVL